MKSTMFLNNITAIDHAYIDRDGWVVGGSVSPAMLVSGQIDPVEAVVIDFSGVKKEIKHIIDAKYSGFDHKLWVIKGFSNCEFIRNQDGTSTVVTPFLIITAPNDAFKYIYDNDNRSPLDHLFSVSNQINREVAEGLRALHPTADINVDTELEGEFIMSGRMNVPAIPFRYVHGLKSSTSWGCQNIAHGHLSYLSASSYNPLETEMLLQRIAAELDKCIFVMNENFFKVTERKAIVKYATLERGYFEMIIDLSNAFNYRIHILESETTVENLVSFVATKWRKQLLAAGVKDLFVSEGLNKGAVVELEDFS